MVGKGSTGKKILPVGKLPLVTISGLILSFPKLTEKFVDLFLVGRCSIPGVGTGARLRAPLGSGSRRW